MVDKKDFEELRDSLLRIINKYKALEKLPQDYGIGEPLYPSEIHTIEIIGRNPRITVTEAARAQGVTKGAVSQTVRRLQQKGLVGKQKDSRNDKTVLLVLEKRGEMAFAGHEAFHARHDASLFLELAKLPPDKIAFLKEVFGKMEKNADKYLEELT